MEGGSTTSFNSYNNLILANCSEGMRFNGHMSAVRRFFCMFVTFDFLFISLFWIICVLINGHTLKQVWFIEIMGYTFSTSSFDIAVCAFLRFALLLLIYGTIQINNRWFIVLSTSLTCLFVGAKAFLYTWNRDTSYPFEVMIFLLSFIIAWAELWFIEVRVLPQERHASQLMQGVSVGSHVQRNIDTSPVIGRMREFLTHQSETATNFYSPLESPFASEIDPEEGVETKEQTPQERDWVRCGEDAMHSAYRVLQANGWKEERRINSTDIIYSKTGERNETVYKLEAVIDCNPTVMFNDCISNFETIPLWNKAVTYCRIVQIVDSKTDITYNVAAEGPGGVVSARDFVSVRSWTKLGDSYLVGGVATIHPNHPSVKQFVRGENGPNCVVFHPYEIDGRKCLFQFLLDVNLRGWIPKGVVGRALVDVLADFRLSLIARAASVKSHSGR